MSGAEGVYSNWPKITIDYVEKYDWLNRCVPEEL